MDDDNNTLRVLGEKAHMINLLNHWEGFYHDSWPEPSDSSEQLRSKIHFLCTHMALTHSEVSEAVEAVRNLDKDNFNEEMADIVIRVVSIAFGLGIDLEALVLKKLEKNKTRGIRHGGKAV